MNDISDDDLRIKVLQKDNGNLIANVNISIKTETYGFITIKGFQIWKSPLLNTRIQEKINISPPSKPFYGHYVQQVFIENQDKWFALESRIYDAYLKVIKFKTSKNEDIDPNELTI